MVEYPEAEEDVAAWLEKIVWLQDILKAVAGEMRKYQPAASGSGRAQPPRLKGFTTNDWLTQLAEAEYELSELVDQLTMVAKTQGLTWGEVSKSLGYTDPQGARNHMMRPRWDKRTDLRQRLLERLRSTPEQDDG